MLTSYTPFADILLPTKIVKNEYWVRFFKLYFKFFILCLALHQVVSIPYPFAGPDKNCRLEQSTRDLGQCFLEPECNNECKSVNEQQCSTVNEEQCTTVNQQKCSTINEQKCSTVQEQECSNVPEQKCSTVNEKKCSSVNEQKCSTVTDTVSEKKCDTVNEEKCDTVNERKCETVNKQKCETVNEKQCQKVQDQVKFIPVFNKNFLWVCFASNLKLIMKAKNAQCLKKWGYSFHTFTMFTSNVQNMN